LQYLDRSIQVTKRATVASGFSQETLKTLFFAARRNYDSDSDPFLFRQGLRPNPLAL